MRKVCSVCGVEKPLSEFHRYSKGVHGRRAACASCVRDKYYGERDRQRAREWHRRNPERGRARSKAWREASPERKRASIDRIIAWSETNPERYKAVDRAHCRSYHAKKNGAMPFWANQFILNEFYDLARMRSRLTGVDHQVDHIVPLRSELVCGLHTEQNLQVILAYDNNQKSNRVWPDMP